MTFNEARQEEQKAIGLMADYLKQGGTQSQEITRLQTNISLVRIAKASERIVEILEAMVYGDGIRVRR